jgi:hypothetical protein
MTRPKIICHMHTLLNGKIDGIANPTSVGMRSQREYFDLFLGPDRFYTGHRGWISGRRWRSWVTHHPWNSPNRLHPSRPATTSPTRTHRSATSPSTALLGVQALDDGSVWLRYRVDGPVE